MQGYACDAKLRCARLARKIWNDEVFAVKLEKQAAELKRRFNRDYWIADRKFFPLALDGSKRKVDSLCSNIGQLLWSGTVDDDKANGRYSCENVEKALTKKLVKLISTQADTVVVLDRICSRPRLPPWCNAPTGKHSGAHQVISQDHPPRYRASRSSHE
jgi:hypothetical protein